jgi:hypothetical integral membrane protein (TIGR02206 family)
LGILVAVPVFPDQETMATPTFHAFNLQHLVTLGIIAAGCLFLAWKGRAEDSRKWLGPVLGLALLGYVSVIYIQQGIEHALSWEYSLPLELCNLVLIACIISLFRPNQFIAEIAYFWGLGGVLQATLTPDLSRGFPSWDFVFFFWSHGVTLMAIVFLIARPGFKPRKGSTLRIMISLNIYAVAVGTLDAIAGWNYGYLCRKPAKPSLLDILGKWPWYLVTLEAIALIMFLILGLPWRISGRSGKLEKAVGTVDQTGEGGECL